MPEYETTQAFNELVQEIAALGSRFEGLDAPSVLEGYRWIFSILQVAFDAYVWADTDRPRFVDIVGP